MGSIRSCTLPVLVVALSGCTFDSTPLRRLNAQFDENSENLKKNVRYLNPLAENTVRLYFDLQIASARRRVRDEFRGAYVPPTASTPEPAISSGKLSDTFRRENADSPLDLLADAASFARWFEDPKAFTLSDGTTTVDFIELHGKVLTGDVAILSGEPLRKYRETLQKYYAFLDRYKPALTYVKRKAAFADAFARFQALLEEELENNREFLKGYKRVAEMKDPVTDVVSSLGLSREDKDLVLSVMNEVKDSGVMSTLNNRLEK